MSLRSLQLRPISTSHYYTSGDVTIHAGVAIAPGVLIQAEADSRIVIRSGACIGIGAILHAHNGTVEIGEGANIGAEVLLVGDVKIGGNACIGAATTIINSVIGPGAIVPPGSLIGDTSRSLNQTPADDGSPAATGQSPTVELQVTDTVLYPEAAESSPSSVQPTEPEPPTPPAPSLTSQEPDQSSGVNVYGRMFVNRMFVKMFPHHSLSQPSSADTSEANGSDPWDD